MNLFKDLNSKRVNYGISIAKLCRTADISYSTWLRNQRGETSPNTRTIEKLDKAIHTIREQKIRDNGTQS
jgi:predicted transcriptional regulator